MIKETSFLDALLVCPLCGGTVTNEADRYCCGGCGGGYPITDGVPRFLMGLSDREQRVRRSFDLEHSRYQQSRHLHFTPDVIAQWLRGIQLPAEWFRGKVVLDAGCGSGRWSYAMAALGATVVAVDFTEEGAGITRQATAGMGNVAVLQANILRLPFRPNTFDLVVSWGVLHHTPDTRAAFERLVPLIKPGGSGYIMVYEKHNPVKFACTNILRRILQRFPEDTRYRFCRHLIIWNPVVHLLLKHVLLSDTRYKVTDPLDISTKQLGLYDAYAPVFNHLHTREDVVSWFADNHFTDITLTSPVRFTRPLDVFRWGACGGAVSVRGVRT